MFLHIGENSYVALKEVLFILDIKSSLKSRLSKEFLITLKKNNQLESLGKEKPKTLIVIKSNDGIKAYYSPISSVTLFKRSNQFDFSCFEMEEF